MSSPEIAERRGLLGNLVAAKAQLYRSAAHRRLLFFLQGLSMRMGGLAAIAEDLFDAFPSKKVSNPSLTAAQSQEFSVDCYYQQGNLDHAELLRLLQVRWLAAFLESLCIDPELDLREIEESKFSSDIPYFTDPIGAIRKYRGQFETADDFKIVTSIGREVHTSLNRALMTQRMIVIEGASGSGKSYAAEHWCRRHLGEARFITLSGITHRTGLFQKIAGALGLGLCQQASSKLQAKIESHLERTKLMLVIDEAHYLWPQHKRTHSAPELIDWVDTALVNNGVPVCLISTDQFARDKARVEKQTGWTSDQFMHRTWRYNPLPQRPAGEDLLKVAAVLLSHRRDEVDGSWFYDDSVRVDPVGVKMVAAYGKNSHLPLGSIRSMVDEARVLAHEEHGRDVVTLREIRQAFDTQQASDVAIRTAFDRTRGRRSTPTPRNSPRSGIGPNGSGRQMPNFFAPSRLHDTASAV